jgi:predicted alpha/beta superfamily hydrolase
MSAASVLTEAFATISSPSKWAKEAVALDQRGNEVKPSSDRAKRFDMVGALQRVPANANDYGAAIRILRAQCGKQSIFEFNDGHGHKAVLTCMRRAIAAAEAV